MKNNKAILSDLIKNMRNREEDPLRPMIDEYLFKRSSSPQRYEAHLAPLVERLRPSGRLSPSTIGGCRRQAAFKFLGVKGRKKIDPDLELIFDHGNWVHHKWQATFLDMQKVLGKEKFKVLSIEEPVSINKLFIHGHLDAAIRILRERYVIDFKSINSFGFERVLESGEPKAEHVQQLTTYMKARKIFKGLLHYENKNTQHTRTYVVNFSNENWEIIKTWSHKVLKQINNRELPDMHPECSGGSYLWEQCPYAYLCYGKNSDKKIEQKAFVNFLGVQKEWEKGHKDYADSER